MRKKAIYILQATSVCPVFDAITLRFLRSNEALSKKFCKHNSGLYTLYCSTKLRGRPHVLSLFSVHRLLCLYEFHISNQAENIRTRC